MEQAELNMSNLHALDDAWSAIQRLNFMTTSIYGKRAQEQYHDVIHLLELMRTSELAHLASVQGIAPRWFYRG